MFTHPMFSLYLFNTTQSTFHGIQTNSILYCHLKCISAAIQTFTTYVPPCTNNHALNERSCVNVFQHTLHFLLLHYAHIYTYQSAARSIWMQMHKHENEQDTGATLSIMQYTNIISALTWSFCLLAACSALFFDSGKSCEAAVSRLMRRMVLSQFVTFILYEFVLLNMLHCLDIYYAHAMLLQLHST